MLPSIKDILADGNLTSDQKFLLIVIREHAHADGTGAYPSLRRLATLTSFSLAHICTLLPALEKTDYLTIERFKGPKGVNAYTLHAPAALSHGAPQERAPQHGARSQRAPQHRDEVQAEEEKTPVLFQGKEHHGTALHTEDHQVDKPPGVVVTEKAAHLVSAWVSPAFSQVLQGKDPDHTPIADATDIQSSAVEPTPPMPRKPRGPALYFQGKLCPGGHDDGTGHTLRRVSNGNCTECDVERTRAKRQAAAAARNAQRTKPARQVIDLAAHRQAQGG